MSGIFIYLFPSLQIIPLNLGCVVLSLLKLLSASLIWIMASAQILRISEGFLYSYPDFGRD